MELYAHCKCGQKLRLVITEEMLGKTLPIRCPSCKVVSDAEIPKVIHDGRPAPAPIPEPKYPYGEKGIEDFTKLFGVPKNNPYFGKRDNH